MWLVRRVLVLGLILSVTCTVVVLISRLNPEPNTLQTLGFGICDGEPCFRGVKFDMNVAEARKLVPDFVKAGEYLELRVNTESVDYVRIFPSEPDGTVRGILISYIYGSEQLLTMGEFLIEYGLPCRVQFRYGQFGEMRLLIPKGKIALNILVSDPYRTRRPQPDASVVLLWTQSEDKLTCESPIDEQIGPWRGFTSNEIFLARYRRPSATTATP